MTLSHMTGDAIMGNQLITTSQGKFR
jgi:hypothetical protein